MTFEEEKKKIFDGIEADTNLKESMHRFTTQASEKFISGQKEHGGNLFKKKGLIKKAKEEVIDMWFYLDALEYQLSGMTDNTGEEEF